MCGCDWIGLNDWTNWIGLDDHGWRWQGWGGMQCGGVELSEGEEHMYWEGGRVRMAWEGGEGELLPAVVVTVIVARR